MSAQTPPRLSGPKLTPQQRAAIAAQALGGASKTSIAQAFDVHRNTVHDIVRSVQQNGADPAQLDWRKRLTDTLPSKSVDAIERSVGDLQDVHKAANTGLQVLKGLGHLANDAPSMNVAVVIQQINSLPADLREHYLCSDLDVVSNADTSDKDNTRDKL